MPKLPKNISITDFFGDDQYTLEQVPVDSGKIDVVQMEFAGAESLKWEELFEGFHRLYAITYSSGIGFICELLKKFQAAEVIFGFDQVMSYQMQEIVAYQLKTIERLRDTSSKMQVDLLARIDNDQLRLFVARSQLSHEKVYLLEADDGRKRVITGSANLSRAAFSGKQRENIIFVDGDRAFDWYMDQFNSLKESSSDEVSQTALRVADGEDHLEEIPVMNTLRLQRSMVIEPVKELNNEMRFALDVSHLANKMAPYMPRAEKNGMVKLLQENVVSTKRRIKEAKTQEKELRAQFPEFVIDPVGQVVTLNDVPLDLNPSVDEVQNDVRYFLEYMNGYRKFHGAVDEMQSKYYSFANWFFASPFMAHMRNMAVKYDQSLLSYPVFGLVYGQSKAGKTTFLETLLKMMIGQKTKLTAPEFTRSNINELRYRVKGAPIIVDDLTQDRFRQHAVETIKNDDFGMTDNLKNYPAVVISANEDVKAVAPEVVRRTVLCHVKAGLKNTDLIKSNIVRKVHKNMGTGLYREYLRRMMALLPDLLNELKDDDSEGAPDLLAVSSRVLLDMMTEYADQPVPDYIRELTLVDYFGEKVTGSQAIKTIRTAWEINPKAFKVRDKQGQLCYDAQQTYEADRVIKELPEDLEAHKSGGLVVMNLDKACEYFEVDFRKGKGFWGLFK